MGPPCMSPLSHSADSHLALKLKPMAMAVMERQARLLGVLTLQR